MLNSSLHKIQLTRDCWEPNSCMTGGLSVYHRTLCAHTDPYGGCRDMLISHPPCSSIFVKNEYHLLPTMTMSNQDFLDVVVTRFVMKHYS